MSESELEVLLLAGKFEVRGSCAYTLRLAGGLAQKGISARVVSPDARLVNAGIRKKLHVEEFRRLDTPIVGELARRLVLCDARRQMPHLLHVQSHRAARLGIWLARRLQRPYVLTMHEHLEDGARLPIDRRYCRSVIAVSESVRDDLARRWFVPPELLTVISSGVDTTAAADLAPPLGPDRVPVIGTAGPLEAIKGFPYFLGAARQVLSVRSEVEFLVAGAGPEEANLRRVARELGISHKVTFVPYVLCFSEALAATDIFCLPSLQQGLGTIMLEAMALGRPVIATGVGGVSSVIRHGETGLIVPPQNSGELARRILELLDQPARARAIGAHARQLVIDEYSVETMVRETVDLYRSLVAAEPLSRLISGPGRAAKA
jgi:glycosyltransferase involved in cell wall biosynthesis